MELQKTIENSHEFIVLLGILVWSLDGFEWCTKLLKAKGLVG